MGPQVGKTAAGRLRLRQEGPATRPVGGGNSTIARLTAGEVKLDDIPASAPSSIRHGSYERVCRCSKNRLRPLVRLMTDLDAQIQQRHVEVSLDRTLVRLGDYMNSLPLPAVISDVHKGRGMGAFRPRPTGHYA